MSFVSSNKELKKAEGALERALTRFISETKSIAGINESEQVDIRRLAELVAEAAFQVGWAAAKQCEDDESD